MLKRLFVLGLTLLSAKDNYGMDTGKAIAACAIVGAVAGIALQKCLASRKTVEDLVSKHSLQEQYQAVINSYDADQDLYDQAPMVQLYQALKHIPAEDQKIIAASFKAPERIKRKVEGLSIEVPTEVEHSYVDRKPQFIKILQKQKQTTGSCGLQAPYNLYAVEQLYDKGADITTDSVWAEREGLPPLTPTGYIAGVAGADEVYARLCPGGYYFRYNEGKITSAADNAGIWYYDNGETLLKEISKKFKSGELPVVDVQLGINKHAVALSFLNDGRIIYIDSNHAFMEIYKPFRKFVDKVSMALYGYSPDWGKI